MRRLWAELTLAEYAVWRYLVILAGEQGDNHVILPRPGEDPDLDAKMSRQYLRKNLRTLKNKRSLTQLIMPRSKSKRIEVFLPAWALDIGKPEFANKGGLANQSLPISTLANYSFPIMQGMLNRWAILPPSLAKLKESFSRYLKLSKQGELEGEIKELTEDEAQSLRFVGRQVAGTEPKAKKLSNRAILYALVRYIQAESQASKEPGGAGIDNAQAWMTKPAREWEAKYGD